MSTCSRHELRISILRMRKSYYSNAHDNLKILSCKWCPIVLFIIYKKPIRFNKIKHQLQTISAKVLAQTLRKLIDGGLVERDGEMYCATATGHQVGGHMGSIIKALSNQNVVV